MTQTVSHENYLAITFANDISVNISFDNNICCNQHKQVGLPCINKKMVKQSSLANISELILYKITFNIQHQMCVYWEV